MKDLFSVSLFDVTPQNLASDSTLRPIIESIDSELKLVTSQIPQEFLLSRIDELDEKTLDLLAWQFHTDFYDLAGNVQMKREAVKNSLLWHMKKGTVWAIHEALRQIGIKADFHPWFETGGEPYTFTLDAIVTDDYYRTAPGNQITENIRRAVEEAKSARSYLAGLTTKIEFHDDVNIYVAHANLLSGNYKISLERLPEPEPTRLFTGIAFGVQGNQRIFPEKLAIPENDIFVGQVSHEFFSFEFGVDLDTMQELLMEFERRIFARFEEHERRINLEIEARHKELKKQLDEIEDLLIWHRD